MYVSRPPTGWRKVEEADFEEFLKTVNWKKGDAFGNADYFEINGERFAVRMGNPQGIFVDPKYLSNESI